MKPLLLALVCLCGCKPVEEPIVVSSAKYENWHVSFQYPIPGGGSCCGDIMLSVNHIRTKEDVGYLRAHLAAIPAIATNKTADGDIVITSLTKLDP